MNIFEKSNQLDEIYAEWFNYRNNLYPEFVTSSKNNSVPEAIPVFSFHNVSSEDMLQKLNYLAANGYSTINTEEYLYLNGKTNGERLVMLTFDDGLESLHSVVFPLLRAYQMKAVAFVLPGEIDIEEAQPGDDSDEKKALCSWRQLESMKEYVDIQSHSLYHWLVYESSELSCFFSPQIKARWQKIDWPIPSSMGQEQPQRDIQFGAPVYKTNSRLFGGQRVFEPGDVTAACVEHVQARGGERFFKSNRWEKELGEIFSEACKGAQFTAETEEETVSSITRCITSSKEILEYKLGSKIRHFCFPFGIGSQMAEKIAYDSGYTSVYYGVKPNYGIMDRGGEGRVNRICRLKDDYIYRLPGKGRKSLFGVFYEKAERRIANILNNKRKVR